ncbi:2468_t:CDS:1, partial [Funneliformis geosporum]
HLYHEPKETFLRLTKILRDREIAQMRKEHNNGETMYFRCFNCSENVIDYQVCQDQTGNIICRQCYHKTD